MPVGSRFSLTYFTPLTQHWIRPSEGARWSETFQIGLVCESVIPSPVSEQQRAIADFLDRETAKIDALVARKERLIELLQEKRTALITRAVTRGLDPNVPMKDSGVEWLGEIPAHWEAKGCGT